MNRKSKVNVSDNQLDPKIKDIIEDLKDGKLSKKEIANKYKVELAFVCRIMKSRNLGAKSEDQEQEVETIKETSIEKEEVNNEKNEYRGGDKMIETKEPISGGYKSGPKPKLTDEKILKIVSDIEDLSEKNTKNLQMVADNNGVSISSVIRYGKEFGVLPEVGKRGSKGKTSKAAAKTKKPAEKKTIKKEEVKTAQNKNNQKKSTTVYHKIETESLVCGMFAERHEMPLFVNKFIFNRAISKKNLFNFDGLDSVVNRFILDNFIINTDKNGRMYSNKDMILYITGLTSAVASIIKLTQKYGVNLTLMHYNNELQDYFPQKIWEEFGNDENPYVDIIGNYTTTTWYDCSYEDIAFKKFYTVRVINFSSQDKNNRDTDIYIYADEKKMWEHYSGLLGNIMTNTEKRMAIFVNITSIKNGKIDFGTHLSQSSNFDYNKK